MKIYKLVAENLTNVGGPMGSNTYLPPYFEDYFESIESAKKKAEKHYGDKTNEIYGERKPIKWEKTSTKNGAGVSSGDMGWVMYDIIPIKVKK